jgi:hypothetical protein
MQMAGDIPQVNPLNPAIEAMFTMLPSLPSSNHCLIALPLTIAGAVRFKAMTLSHISLSCEAKNESQQKYLRTSSSEKRIDSLTISATASNLSIRPAQFTTKSSLPNIFSPSKKTSSIFSSLVISACTASVHSGYAEETFSLKSAMSSELISTTTTFAPARKNASEMARPRPPQPPVTRAVFWRNDCWLMMRCFSRCPAWLVEEVEN